MKVKYFFFFVLITACTGISAQERTSIQYLDQILMQGDYTRVIDTCRQLLDYDKLSPEIYFRLGLAYQNILEEDLALENFSQAYNLSPDDRIYSFMFAKSLYGKEKYKPAREILERLSTSDSLNWTYASYLSGIYMQQRQYDDAIRIYNRFLPEDSLNFRYLDKIGFAYLKKGDNNTSIRIFSKSLSVNKRDLTAIKNLAYLYSAAGKSDTAIALLTRGIEIDSSDISLYSLRAQIYYLRNYKKRALDDYLVVMTAGDSSELILKRIGIGYCNNLQPAIAIGYLLKAHKIDSLDYETCSYLGQSYADIDDPDKSIAFYNKAIGILSQVQKQLGISYTLLAEVQLEKSMFREAVDSYRKVQRIAENPLIFMTIANIYDEKLSDSRNAIYYYQAFLDGIKKSGGTFPAKYLDSIRDRIEYLKSNPGK